MSQNSIGGRSLLAQQMNNNGLNFENNSSRLQRMIGSRDRSQNRSVGVSEQPLSPSKTIKNLKTLGQNLIDGDGGSPHQNNLFTNQKKTGRDLKTPDEQPLHKQQEGKTKPIGRPVGCKTMNDREFQQYQRSLFLQSSSFDGGHPSQLLLSGAGQNTN